MVTPQIETKVQLTRLLAPCEGLCLGITDNQKMAMVERVEEQSVGLPRENYVVKS